MQQELGYQIITCVQVWRAHSARGWVTGIAGGEGSDHLVGLNRLRYSLGLTVTNVASHTSSLPWAFFSPYCPHRPPSPGDPSAVGDGRGRPVVRCGVCITGAGVYPTPSSHQPPPPPLTCLPMVESTTSPPPPRQLPARPRGISSVGETRTGVAAGGRGPARWHEW